MVDYKDSSKRRTSEYSENQKQDPKHNIDYFKNNLKVVLLKYTLTWVQIKHKKSTREFKFGQR